MFSIAEYKLKQTQLSYDLCYLRVDISQCDCDQPSFTRIFSVLTIKMMCVTLNVLGSTLALTINFYHFILFFPFSVY